MENELDRLRWASVAGDDADREGNAMAVAVTDLFEPVAGDLLTVFDQLVVPEGYRAELIEGEIVVSPPPQGNHENAVASINWQVARRSATEMYAAGTKGVATPRGMFIPDSVIGPVGLFRDQESWMFPEGVAMIVEATSNRPNTDREPKRYGYAGAEVPLYLLVDRARRELVLFSDPSGGDYRAEARVPFGSPLNLPAPFSFTLETAPFA